MTLELTFIELKTLYKNIRRVDPDLADQMIIVDIVAKMEKLLKEKPNAK